MRSPLVVLVLALSTSLFACSEGADSGDTQSEEVNAAATKGNGLKVFDCKTADKIDGKSPRIQFSVRNINDKKKFELLDPNGKEDEENFSPIKVTPDSSRLSALNENGTAGLTQSRAKKEKAGSAFRISGDSDGFFLVEFVLFRDSDFKSGFVRIHHADGDGGPAFSNVSCTVTDGK